MADVFISFIHEEEQIALAVRNLLHERLEQGQTVFLMADTWQRIAGEDWLDRIREELTPAHVVILLFSRVSVARHWVHFEAGAAWLAGKTIIPVCFGGLRVEELPRPYSNYEALDLREGFYFLVRSVHHLLTQGQNLPPLPFSPWDAAIIALRAALDQYDEAQAET